MREAQIVTEHGSQEMASRISRAVRPDNTDAMETNVEGSQVRTRIRRGTTGGLHATVDDYIVNVDVAVKTHTTHE